MTKIILSEDYFIRDTSGISYDVVQDLHTVDDKGRSNFKTISYHPTVESALNSYARYIASKKLKGEFTPGEYVTQYNEIVADIQRLVYEI